MITIFVAKLDFGVSENELFELFKQYGTVAKVTVAKDKETNKSRGFAFVEMPNRDQAQQAIDALDGYSFNGRTCAVKEAENRSNNSSEQRGGGQANRFENRGPRTDNRGGREDNRGNRDDKKFFKPRTDENKPRETTSFRNNEDNDGAPTGRPEFTPSDKPSPIKKKKEDKPKTQDNTADGKNKKQKMNAYKKSGKDNIFIDNEDDEELDIFGRNDEEEDEDYKKYLVNQDDEDEEWDDDDEEWDDDDDDDDQY
jgi:RNA recognition motif-containing protein